MSHVAMTKHQCPVCTKVHTGNEILIHKQLKDIDPEKVGVSGISNCDECTEKMEGRIALIGIDPSKSKITDNVIKPGDEYRTGVVAYVRTHVLEQIFNIPVPDSPVIFVENEVIKLIEGMMADSE